MHTYDGFECDVFSEAPKHGQGIRKCRQRQEHRVTDTVDGSPSIFGKE